MSDNLADLRARLSAALAARARALKGSDKTWRRECEREVQRLRALVLQAVADARDTSA